MSRKGEIRVEGVQNVGTLRAGQPYDDVLTVRFYARQKFRAQVVAGKQRIVIISRLALKRDIKHIVAFKTLAVEHIRAERRKFFGQPDIAEIGFGKGVPSDGRDVYIQIL